MDSPPKVDFLLDSPPKVDFLYWTVHQMWIFGTGQSTKGGFSGLDSPPKVDFL